MIASHKITIDIPDDIFDEIAEFKKRANIKDDKSAVFELIKYALSLPEYFKSFDWTAAELEADKDIASGRIKDFFSVDELLVDLKA